MKNAGASASAESTALVPAAAAKLPMNNLVDPSGGSATTLALFEDLSLPPIIKPKGLQKGNVIFGEIDGFSAYDDGKKIRSALIVLHVLRGRSEDGKLERIGQRAAIPVGAVLAKSLGSGIDPAKTPAKINEEIQAAGWTKGTILAMQYQGEGQRRDSRMNNPHLWNIKAIKPDAAHTVLVAETAAPALKSAKR